MGRLCKTSLFRTLSMKTPLPSVDQMNRLAKAVMQRHRLPYEEAVARLGRLRLHLVLPAHASHRPQYQAALVTAVNCGKRAFLGGVSIELPANQVCVLKGWLGRPLTDVLLELGGTVMGGNPDADKTVLIGGAEEAGAEDVVVVADGWRGGLLSPGCRSPFRDEDTAPLGGVFAAGLAVGRAFMDVSGISAGALDESFGLSLWRPDLGWLDDGAAGPPLARLPEKLWLLGLGHLGQAYLWTLGLLPYPESASPLLFLQDYDHITEGNWCAGLLCEPKGVGRHKTRVCAEWAERRGFRTMLIERPFDATTRAGATEPRVALCGFDSASGRRVLERAGFNLTVESGLGSSLTHFDRIMLHTFPDATKRPEDIWPETAVSDVADFDRSLFSPDEDEGECGILVDDLARKPISASFVGVAASAMVVAEILRGLHGGRRFELVAVHLRSNSGAKTVERNEAYQLRHAMNGAVALAR